ncbi:MAG: hypothetical protein H6836_04820 [Planctomycetes bacterium]|nr:hypothetical protein [Planctomycetota bacterium]
MPIDSPHQPPTKRSSRPRMVPYAALAALCLLAGGCNVLSSGRKYTLAKIDRQGNLVEPHRRLPPADDGLERVPRRLSVVLNGGFIRYLDAVDRPEVAIFARVKVRKPNEAEETLVFEKVYLMSENASEQLVLAKDTFLPREDIPLLPGIEYDGKDEIYVSLRVVELDSADNDRIRSLVNAAASATATIDPHTALGASVFQTVLTFLTRNNPDDIEFQFDFALIPGSDRPTVVVDQSERYLVLPPCIARYAVLKTEHRDRLIYPDNYFDAAQHGVRYLLASLLKIGTLGVCNWTVWNWLGGDPEDDFYLKIMGRPFATDRSAWRLPEFTHDGLKVAQDAGVVRAPGSHLVYCSKTTNGQGTVEQRRTFVDQGYLTLSVIETREGIDVASLRAANRAKKSIDSLVRTAQLEPEAFRAAVESVAADTIRVKFKGRLGGELEDLLAGAKSPAEVSRAFRAVEQRMDELGISAVQRTALRADLLAIAQSKHRSLGGSGELAGARLERDVALLTQAAADQPFRGQVKLIHPTGAKLELLSSSPTTGVEAPVTVAGLTYSTIRLESASGAPAEHTVRVLVGGVLYEFGLMLVGRLTAQTIEVGDATGTAWQVGAPWSPGRQLRITVRETIGNRPALQWLKEHGMPLTARLGDKDLPAELDAEGRLRLTNNTTAAVEPGAIALRPSVVLPR